MRKLLLSLFVFLPIVTFSQITNDGKSDVITIQTSPQTSAPFTLLFAGSTKAPFGIKLQYCKSLGVYAAVKTDFELIQYNSYLTAGALKSIGKSANLYFGGGFDLVRYVEDGSSSRDSGYLIETGTVLKHEKFAFDFGLGLAVENWDYHENGIKGIEKYRSIFMNFGIGFSF
jgi:hypothetical protein